VNDVFAEQRPRLFALAYRMLGSAASAEDVLQEAWLRWQSASGPGRAGGGIATPAAWLSTVVTHLCLDELKSARARHESYVGPWLPEPIATTGDEIDPETVSMAFLRVLERLTPVERAVYLLHAVFDSTHAEIAAMLGKDEATVRQVFHRAKAHVLSERPRFAPSKEAHARLLGSFVDACTRGDVTALRSLLADDATAWTDGGGRVRAALNPLFGSDAVARFFVGVVRKGAGDGIAVSLAEVNGWPTVVGRRGETTTTTLSIETDGNKIFAVHVVSNPEKLLRV
jgi:RNA polymerase sigma-70 factor (ECF subfamily)